MEEVAQLRQFGFHWPEPGVTKGDYGTKKARLDAARLVLTPVPQRLPAIMNPQCGSYKGKPPIAFYQRTALARRKATYHKMTALGHGLSLKRCREELEEEGYSFLLPCGNMVFVRPHRCRALE